MFEDFGLTYVVGRFRLTEATISLDDSPGGARGHAESGMGEVFILIQNNESLSHLGSR